VTDVIPAASAEKSNAIFDKSKAFLKSVYIFKDANSVSINDKIKRLFTTVLSVSFWIYVIFKVFVFDIDLWIIKSINKNMIWVLEYKAVLALCIISFVWVWFRTKDFIALMLYLILYPFKLCFLVIPIKLGIFIYKMQSWILLLSISIEIVSFFRNLKLNFVLLSVFVLSSLIVFVSVSHLALYAASLALFALILVGFLRSFIASLSPNGAISAFASVFRGDAEGRFKSYALEEDVKSQSFDQMQPDQLAKWNNSLEKSVLYNRVLLFFAKKLRDYQRSPMQILPSIFGITRLLVFTILSFSLINIALYKINSNLYIVKSPPYIFTFIYFSFNSQIFNSIDELKPVMVLSQCVTMAQEFLSFFFGVILITLVLSQKAQRASSDLDEAIRNAEKEASSIELWIKSEYKIASVQYALEHLRNAETSLAKFIFWLSKGI